MKGKLGGVVGALIGWAVVITIGIAVMVVVVYKRMRSQQARASERTSEFVDTESGRGDSSIQDSPSIITVDDHRDGQTAEATMSPTHVDIDTVGELYEDDSNETASKEALPQFGRALASNNGRLQGLYVPDNRNF